MKTCAQPVVSAGEPTCASRSGEGSVHAFGPFDPFSGQWRAIAHWNWGDRSDPERLFSLRCDTRSSIRTGGPHAPVEGALRALDPSPTCGFLRLRVHASRSDGKASTDFFCDASGVDIYANHVHAELWAPDPVVSAGSAEASQGATLGVLDEVVAPSVTRIGSSLRGRATLHTYAAAGADHPVPARATRYAVLSGGTPDLQIAGIPVVGGAPAVGPVGGIESILLDENSVVVWEVAP